jgi:hypothetical protein
MSEEKKLKTKTGKSAKKGVESELVVEPELKPVKTTKKKKDVNANPTEEKVVLNPDTDVKAEPELKPDKDVPPETPLKPKTAKKKKVVPPETAEEKVAEPVVVPAVKPALKTRVEFLAVEEDCPIRHLVEVCKEFDDKYLYLIFTEEGLRIYGIDSTSVWIVDSFISKNSFKRWSFSKVRSEEDGENPRITLKLLAQDMKILNCHKGHSMSMVYDGGSEVKWATYDENSDDVRLSFDAQLLDFQLEVFDMPFSQYSTSVVLDAPFIGKIIKNFSDIDSEVVIFDLPREKTEEITIKTDVKNLAFKVPLKTASLTEVGEGIVLPASYSFSPSYITKFLKKMPSASYTATMRLHTNNEAPVMFMIEYENGSRISIVISLKLPEVVS